MATDWAIKDMKTITIKEHIMVAEQLKQILLEKNVSPAAYYRYDTGCKLAEMEKIADITDYQWGKNDSIILDFGHHGVGYLSFSCAGKGSPQDAPAFLKVKFCEVERELYEESEDYNGWISRGWIQEEWLHLDQLPKAVAMERRYAFRYVKIDILDTSPKFKVAFDHFIFKTVSAVNMETVPLVETQNKMFRKIDEASLRTLQNCMQDVFEDGPKRDRRLWLGDLRLQAMINYHTFKDYNLVKRCLYLFAGMTKDDGMIAACLFTEPKPLMDDTFLLDYSLFFISALLDYYQASKDMETLKQLGPSALRQIELAEQFMNEEMIFEPEGRYHCFVDWNEILHKQCAMQGIYLFTLRDAIQIAELLGDCERVVQLNEKQERCKASALKKFWDEEQQVFISGPDRQISWASQAWMIASGMKQGQEAQELLRRISGCEVGMVTPYMNHVYVQALLDCGGVSEAGAHIRYYWGKMVEEGADTFWELFNPENPEESPYGSSIINSYCHAWSCTPAYFMREYPELL